MVVVSYSGKEINAKLVYYGAGLSGKTTNLESIYEAVPDTSRGKMVSMKTQSDRTLFFDLLPLDLGEIIGFKTRFLLYTVPGQVFYNATRKLVLKGADAVVFVADSEIGKMEENQESLGNLRINLAEYGLRLDEIPWVLQYNKRDLPNIYSVEELNAELNPDGSVQWFEAVACEGKGVFETFRGVSHLLMEKVTRDLRRKPIGGGTSRSDRPEISPAAAIDALGPRGLPTAHASPAEAATAKAGSEASFEFGREVDLPAEAPLHHEPPALRRPESISVPAPVASMPSAAPPAFRGPAAFSALPEPVVPVAAAVPVAPAHTVAPSAPAFTVPASVAHGAEVAPARLEPEPCLTGQRPSDGSRPGLKPAPRVTTTTQAPVETGVTETVIPVSIPRGGSREIVLRIVIADSES